MTHNHRRKRNERWLFALVPAVTVILVALLVWASAGERAPAPESGAPGDGSATAPAMPEGTLPAPEIALDDPPLTLSGPAKVQVSGSYPAAEPGTTLRVQLLGADGSWVSFPLPTTVDETGRFATFVELARRGTSRLRVVDPASSAISNVVTVRVR